jgi:hypothetical protein
MYTPIEQETSIVKNAIFEAYVKYGMNVFEYEHTEKERIREEETDEVSLEQAQGVIHKKDHTEQERRIMTLSVCSGGTTGRRDTGGVIGGGFNGRRLGGSSGDSYC